MLLLLSLLFPLVFPRNYTCPDPFLGPFVRKPTDKNNNTILICLGLVHYYNLGDRDRARSACRYVGGALALPENDQEFDFFSKGASIMGVDTPIAIDGEVTGQCKLKSLENAWRGRGTFNGQTEKGECNVHKNYYTFDSPNTDPQYMKDRHFHIAPYTYGDSVEEGPYGQMKLTWADLCLVMKPHKYNLTSVADWNKNLTRVSNGEFDMSYCGGIWVPRPGGPKVYPESIIHLAFCGLKLDVMDENGNEKV